MTGERCLVDTNVLLSATDTARTTHAASRTFLETRRELVAPAQLFREYVVVATRPLARNGLGLTSEMALANLETLRGIVGLLPEERPLLRTTLGLVARFGTKGARIHDVAIVAAAIVHDVQDIATYNVRDFVDFVEHVRAIRPDEERAE